MDFNFMNKEERENVTRLNKIMGTNFRIKPYDLNKKEDLIEATTMVTAEYVDMAHYWSTLIDIMEKFDESLEIFNTAAWVNIGLKGTSDIEIYDEATFNLSATTSNFYDILQESEERCAQIWKYVLNNPIKEVHEYFFQEVIECEAELIDFILAGDNLYDLFLDIEYDGVIENSVNSFVEYLLKQIKQSYE